MSRPWRACSESEAQRTLRPHFVEGIRARGTILAAADYGVLSGSVAERAREIGVRSALGLHAETSSPSSSGKE